MIILSCVSVFAQNSTATEAVRLELGEDFLIPIKSLSGDQKIWIESGDVLQAEQRQTNVAIKTRRQGRSHIRVGSTLKKILVYAVGTRSAIEYWKKFKSDYPFFELRYCEFQLCLTGKIESDQQYNKMRSLLAFLTVPVLIKVSVNAEYTDKLKKKMALVLRENGFTPQKIILNGLWRTYTNRSQLSIELRRLTATMGLQLEAQSNINTVADNVSVSVKVVEINKNLVRKIGITWPDQYNANILDFKNLRMADSFEIFLSAAEAKGEARVLASPRLMARSGQQADFFAGGEFPIKIQGLRSNHVSWRKYGVSLKLKPVSDALGQLSLSIETEISTVDNSMKVEDLPAVHINRVSSHFDMINHKTVALSGLIRNESSQNQSGLPYLQNIPIIGSLFRSQQFTESKTELVVFVTPKLITEEEGTL